METVTDIIIDQKTRDLLNQVGNATREKLSNIDVFATLVTQNFMKSNECAMQLGHAVILGKPIILLVDKGVVLPKGMIRCADVVKNIDTSSDSWPKEATDAIAQYIKGVGK